MAKLRAYATSNINSIVTAATLLLLLVGLTAEGGEGYGRKVEEKTSHLHFYFHITVSGKNVNSVSAVSANGSFLNLFGLVEVIENLSTKGPEPTSQLVGRMQGLYTLSGIEENAMQMVATFVFSSRNYNGRSLSVVGINPIHHPVREIPIVGASGLFRMARGYALLRAK